MRTQMQIVRGAILEGSALGRVLLVLYRKFVEHYYWLIPALILASYPRVTHRL